MVEAKEGEQQELPLPAGSAEISVAKGRPDPLARMGGHNQRGSAVGGAARTAPPIASASHFRL